MMAYLHLAHDAADIFKRMADCNGRVPVEEHYPEVFLDGEDCYLLDWSRLTNQQRVELVAWVAINKSLNVHEAEKRCRWGVPVGRGQANALEVQGELHSLDEVVYAPQSPDDVGFDPDEVVF